MYIVIKVWRAWDSIDLVTKAKIEETDCEIRHIPEQQTMPKTFELSTERFLYFIRNMSIIWHSINNRTSTSPNSAVRLSCRIAGVGGFAWTRFSLFTKIKRKTKKKTKKKKRRLSAWIWLAQLSTHIQLSLDKKLRNYKIHKCNSSFIFKNFIYIITFI